MRDIIVKIAHDDDLLLMLNTMKEESFKIMKELDAWTCLIVFGKEVSSVLLIHSVGAVWVWATGSVDLNYTELFVMLTLKEGRRPAT